MNLCASGWGRFPTRFSACLRALQTNSGNGVSQQHVRTTLRVCARSRGSPARCHDTIAYNASILYCNSACAATPGLRNRVSQSGSWTAQSSSTGRSACTYHRSPVQRWRISPGLRWVGRVPVRSDRGSGSLDADHIIHSRWQRGWQIRLRQGIHVGGSVAPRRVAKYSRSCLPSPRLGLCTTT